MQLQDQGWKSHNGVPCRKNYSFNTVAGPAVGVREEPRNMKSMCPHWAAIFLWLIFKGPAGGGGGGHGSLISWIHCCNNPPLPYMVMLQGFLWEIYGIGLKAQTFLWKIP